VAVAVARVVLGFASRQEPVVALVLLVPLDVPEELEAVFGGRAAVRRPVDRDADREVVDRPAGRDEVFRSTVVHVAVALVELCHVPPEPSVHDVGPVELGADDTFGYGSPPDSGLWPSWTSVERTSDKCHIERRTLVHSS
jgi:hypothetical protein